MSPFLKNTLLATVTLGTLFSVTANATNSIVVQSCVTNQNYDEPRAYSLFTTSNKNS